MTELLFSGSGIGESFESDRCGLPPSFPTILNIPRFLDKIQAGGALFLGTLGAILHFFLIFIVIKYRPLLHYSLLIAMGVVGNGLLNSVLISPIIFVSGMVGEWVFGLTMCQITGLLHDGAVCFRVILNVAVSLNHILSIFTPLFYTNRHRVIGITLSLIPWILAIIRGVGNLSFVFDCYAYVPTFKLCTGYRGCTDSCPEHLLFWVMFLFFGLLGPFIFAILIFFKNKRTLPVAVGDFTSERSSREIIKKASSTIILLNFTSIGFMVPAYLFYSLQLLYGKPNSAIIIMGMLIGRVSYYLVPIGDALVMLYHRDIWDKVMIVYNSFYPPLPVTEPTIIRPTFL